MPRRTLYRAGSVYSPADPFATALVVEGGAVAWVGGEGAADGYAGAVDEVVDLGGALVTPAFVDAHVHATATGLSLTALDLGSTSSLGEALDLLSLAAARLAPGAVVIGTGWDDSRWPERRRPGRAELDRAGGGRPVYLSRVDVHSAVVSSALRAGLTGVRPGDEVEEVLLRGAHEAARRLAYGSLTAEQRATAQRAFLREAASLGVAGVHEMAGPAVSSADDLAGLLEVAAETGVEVVGYWGERGETGVARARALGARGAAGDLVVDGSIGSRTAWLRERYADAPDGSGGGCGSAYLDAAAVADHLVACTRAGVQGGFHAIGDAAVDAVVEGFDAAAAAVGAAAVRAGRHRVEHLVLADDDHVARLAGYGVCASVQPAFDAAWGGPSGVYAARLGAERSAGSNPLASFARAGVPLALGSDAPVTPVAPWAGVRAAAFHSDPAQRLSARAAFAAATRGGRRAAGDDAAGVLVPGAPATFALWETGQLVVQAPDERVSAWSTDPRSGTPGLPDLTPGLPLPQCLRTVVAGTAVHDRPTR